MTPSYEVLRELVERVEAATGADRELDLLIGRHVAGLTPPSDSDPLRRWSGPGVAFLGAVPSYTSSLDAITVLIERVYPGAGHGYQKGMEQDGPEIVGFILLPLGSFGTRAEGIANAPARAMCSALLRAKLQEKEG